MVEKVALQPLRARVAAETQRAEHRPRVGAVQGHADPRAPPGLEVAHELAARLVVATGADLSSLLAGQAGEVLEGQPAVAPKSLHMTIVITTAKAQFREMYPCIQGCDFFRY